jgi:hypothetical protein
MLLATTRETCVKNRRNTAGTMQMTAFNRPRAPAMGSKRHAPLARREFCKRLMKLCFYRIMFPARFFAGGQMKSPAHKCVAGLSLPRSSGAELHGLKDRDVFRSPCEASFFVIQLPLIRATTGRM